MTRSEIPKASSDLVCAKLTDVIFGDSAINYEEGKWAVEKGVKVFKPEFRMIEGKAGEISSFAQNRRSRSINTELTSVARLFVKILRRYSPNWAKMFE